MRRPHVALDPVSSVLPPLFLSFCPPARPILRSRLSDRRVAPSIRPPPGSGLQPGTCLRRPALLPSPRPRHSSSLLVPLSPILLVRVDPLGLRLCAARFQGRAAASNSSPADAPRPFQRPAQNPRSHHGRFTDQHQPPPSRCDSCQCQLTSAQPSPARLTNLHPSQAPPGSARTARG